MYCTETVIEDCDPLQKKVVKDQNYEFQYGMNIYSAYPYQQDSCYWHAPNREAILDYVTEVKGSYYDLNGKGPSAGGNYYTNPPSGLSTQIYCVTCKGKRGYKPGKS